MNKEIVLVHYYKITLDDDEFEALGLMADTLSRNDRLKIIFSGVLEEAGRMPEITDRLRTMMTELSAMYATEGYDYRDHIA